MGTEMQHMTFYLQVSYWEMTCNSTQAAVCHLIQVNMKFETSALLRFSLNTQIPVSPFRVVNATMCLITVGVEFAKQIGLEEMQGRRQHVRSPWGVRWSLLTQALKKVFKKTATHLLIKLSHFSLTLIYSASVVWGVLKTFLYWGTTTSTVVNPSKLVPYYHPDGGGSSVAYSAYLCSI